MVHTGRGTVAVDPDSVAGARFAQSFRGYDAHEVQAFLLAVSDELRSLRARLEDAEERAATLETRPPSLPSTVGEEAGRVLTAAEEAARDIRARAEDAVAKMLRDAQDEITADRSRAQQDRADLIAGAEAEAASVRELAEGELEAARSEGRAMVAEAREVRERVLANLAEKRSLARRELAQLKAGIDELRSSYSVLEELLAASMGAVDAAIPNARAAAMAAAENMIEDSSAAHYASPGVPLVVDDEEDDARSELSEPTDEHTGHDTDATERAAAQLEAALEHLDRLEQVAPAADGFLHSGAAPDETVEEDAEGADDEKIEPVDVSESAVVESQGLSEGTDDEASASVGDGDALEGVGSAAVIDLDARRSSLGSTSSASERERSSLDTDELDLSALADDPEFDPVLPNDDVIEERRQAERRQLFGARTGSPGDHTEGSLLADLGPADGPVPLVSAREASNVDDLFARIRESRAGAVAQAREVLSRTAELPVVELPSQVEGVQLDDQAEDLGGQEPGGTRDEAGPALTHGLPERDVTIDELRADAALALKRCLADQLNEVLDVLRRTPEGVSDVALLVPEAADRAFGESMKDQLLTAGRRGSLTGDVDVTAIVRAVGTDVGTSLRGRLAPYLFDGDQLERRIRGVYREWRRERVDDLAQDALAAAYASGLFASIPDGTRVRWVVPEGGCCGAECHDNSLADEVVVGEPFPTGDLMAPAGPGCRSLVLPRGR